MSQLLTTSSLPKVRFTPRQYFYLSEHNLLGEGRTELINGEILRMCSQYNLHAWAVSEIADWLQATFPKKRFWVRVQMTLQCGDNVPEPDLSVINGPRDAELEYMAGEKALLVVEVSDSTLLADTRMKPAIYASAGIPEYWVLDLENRQVIVHRQPVQMRGRWKYAAVSQHQAGEKIACLAAPKRKLLVNTLFPSK